jgi:hypothetical protein
MIWGLELFDVNGNEVHHWEYPHNEPNPFAQMIVECVTGLDDRELQRVTHGKFYRKLDEDAEPIFRGSIVLMVKEESGVW